MSLLGDIGNTWANVGAIATRDAGHAINGSFNAIGLGQLNPGSTLVDASRYIANPAPILNLAQGGGNPTKNTSQAGNIPQISANNTPTQDSIYNPGGAAGSTSAASQAAAQTAAQRSQGINTINSALGRIPNQLDIALGNIGNQFNQNLNELNSAKTSAQTQYNTGTTQAGQALQTNKNQIADQASSGLLGLLRILGANGAGGSSDVSNVGQAVANQASQQRAGAGQTYATNMQNLDQNWNDFLGKDEQSRKQLNDWNTQQQNSARAQSASTKSSLLQQLIGLQTSAGDAQPYIDQVNSLAGQIDNLGRINPTYTGTVAQYTAPTLASYLAQQAGTQASQPNLPAGVDPAYASLYLAQQKDKNALGQ